jgi:hypothetical protein
MTKARDISKLLSTANGKIAGANLDVSFENISDTGTAGTKVASGTTNQRGSTAGQIRFNTTTGLAEYYTGTEFKSIDTPPTISSIDVTNIETSLGGTQTFIITGTLFNASATVKFRDSGGTLITPDTTTVNSSTQITVTKTRSSFSNANEPYDIIVTNPSNLSAALENQINVDNSPTWNTASGSLGTIFSNSTGNHFTLSATDPDGDTVSYSETGGTVLSTQGLTLNSSSGIISGDPIDVASNTTLSFNARATGNSTFADRAFSILLRPPITINTFDIFGDNSALAFYKLDGNGNDLGGTWNATAGSAISYSASGGKFNGFVTGSSGGNDNNNLRVVSDTFANYFAPSVLWSFSKWFKPTTGNSYMTINGSLCWWYIYTDGGANTNVQALHYNSGSGTNINLSGNYTNNGQDWQHMVITNNPNGQCKIYVNNTLIASASSTTSTANYESGAYRADITPAQGGSSGASVDHYRLFNKELSAEQVTQLYNEVG